MPPRRFSRHMFSAGIKDDDQNLHLTPPLPFRFQAFSDNERHVVKGTETLWSIAARRMRGAPRPAGFFWLLAWFQPDPIHDPTLRLAPGLPLIVPSLTTLHADVFDESRRDLGEGTVT